MMRLERAGYRIGGRDILRDVDLELVPGELVGVLGPNGAGKSTLLKLLSGEARASGGQVLFAGAPLAAQRADRLARRRAVLAQENRIEFGFTALQVTLMGRYPHCKGRYGAPDLDIARRALKALDALHLEARLYPGLSGGEKGRVLMARALAQVWDQDEAVLLLDEPTAALDVEHQLALLAYARDWAAQHGHAVLAILHDLGQAARFCQRVALLSEGRLVALGAPRDTLTPEYIARVFNVRARWIEADGQAHVLIEGRQGTSTAGQPAV